MQASGLSFRLGAIGKSPPRDGTTQPRFYLRGLGFEMCRRVFWHVGAYVLCSSMSAQNHYFLHVGAHFGMPAHTFGMSARIFTMSAGSCIHVGGPFSYVGTRFCLPVGADFSVWARVFVPCRRVFFNVGALLFNVGTCFYMSAGRFTNVSLSISSTSSSHFL